MRRLFIPREPNRTERFAALAVAAGVAVVGAGVAYYLVRTMVSRDVVTSGAPRLVGEGAQSPRAIPSGEGVERG